MNRTPPSLALSLALSLAACGGGSNDDDDDVTVDAAPPADPYTIDVFDDARITSDGSQPNFQKITAEIDLRDGPFASATLVLDLASTCFPFEGWDDNPPPQGENWPADCDAFDRNFEITLDEPLADGDPPAIELSRAITPFGGPMHLEIDVTDVANARGGVHRVQAYIATWSDGAGQVSGSNGGWNVSARFELVPGAAPRNVVAVLPLVNTSLGAGPAPAPVSFTVPDGVASARVEYRVTGHGGANPQGDQCIGPAEEFCRRVHHVSIDGEELEDDLRPWRNDCEDLCTIATYQNFDYCAENPCGAIQSVEASRANWCPGSPTPPLAWDVEALTAAGEHEFAYSVDGVLEGGSWRTSAMVYLYGP